MSTKGNETPRPQTTVVLDGRSLTAAKLARLARDPSVRVAADPAAMQRLAAGRRVVESVAAAYRERFASKAGTLPRVYGVTTGFGEFKDEDVAPEELEALQRNILLSHSCGIGESTDENDAANYFAPEVVRAALAMRVNTFLKGHSAVRPELAECILAMLNRGVAPLVPIRGSVGSSGDLCPLAHLFVVLLGQGRFRIVADEAGRVRFDPRPGTELAAALGEPWASRGVPTPSFKEGLALSNGATFSGALLALAVHDAEHLAETADLAAAVGVEAMCGRTRAFDPMVHEARGMAGQIASAANLRSLLAGSLLVDRVRTVQDPYCLRCAPQVHGACRDVIAYARAVAEAELNAATDNPLFFAGRTPWDIEQRRKRRESQKGAGPQAPFYARAETDLGDEQAFSAGNFHGEPVGIAADALAIAVAELASISERRCQLLLDGKQSRGLPPNLTHRPGVQSGFMLVQYAAASLVSENKVLAHPSSVDSIPTGANTEDHVAMSTTAARKLRTIIANTQAVLACELLVSAAALEWRVGGEIDPDAPPATVPTPSEEWAGKVPVATGAGAAAAHAVVRSCAAPMFADRLIEPDIRAVRRAVERGEFARVRAAPTGGEG